MEKELQSLYTNSKFKEFQQEIKEKLYCEVSRIESDDSKYKVIENCKFGEKRRHVTFEVSFGEKNSEVDCNCKLFEFRGILCRHAISVLIHKNIYHLPVQYIFRRWRKDVKRCHTRVRISYNAMSIKTEVQRLEKMCTAFEEVADLAKDNESKCKRVLGWINDLKRTLHAENNMTGLESVPFITENEIHVTEVASNVVEKAKITSPLVMRGKGRPPSKRKQSIVEKAVKKKRKSKKNINEEENAVNVQVSQDTKGIKSMEANDEFFNMSLSNQGADQLSEASYINQSNYFPPSAHENLNPWWQGAPVNHHNFVSDYSYYLPSSVPSDRTRTSDPSFFCNPSVPTYAGTLQHPPFQEFYPRVWNKDHDNANNDSTGG